MVDNVLRMLLRRMFFVELLVVLVTIVLKHQQVIQKGEVQGVRRGLEEGW